MEEANMSQREKYRIHLNFELKLSTCASEIDDQFGVVLHFHSN